MYDSVQGPNVGYPASPGVTQPWGVWIKQVLDAGADGVIVPQVRTADEVRAIVADCRYPTGLHRPAPFDQLQSSPTAQPSYLKRGYMAQIPSNCKQIEFLLALTSIQSGDEPLLTHCNRFA